MRMGGMRDGGGDERKGWREDKNEEQVKYHH